MPRGRPLKALEVSQDAREELESLVRSRSLPAGLVRRAKIVLLCAGGLDNKAVAERGPHQPPNGRQVARALPNPGAHGPVRRTQAGKAALHRRRRTHGAAAEDTLETEPPDGGTHWSCRSMADATGVSKSTAQWHMMPQCHPNYKTVHRRFQKWCRTGVLDRALRDLAGETPGLREDRRVGSLHRRLLRAGEGRRAGRRAHESRQGHENHGDSGPERAAAFGQRSRGQPSRRRSSRS